MVTITKTIEVEVDPGDLREELIAQIIKHGPQHFDMGSWLYDRSAGRRFDLDQTQCFAGFNECGTTACLAGHAAHLVVNVHKLDPGLVETSEDIAQMFGIDVSDVEPFSATSYNWPDVMREAYNVSLELGDDRPVAEWRAALAYLISLREQDD